MDSVKSTPDGFPSALISPAAERNSAAILEVLRAHLPAQGRVLEIAALTKPDRVHWCDGSAAEKSAIVADLIGKGTLKELDQAKRPGCYYAASDPKDVARVESRTFICSQDEADAGPTNNWSDPVEMRARLDLSLIHI